MVSKQDIKAAIRAAGFTYDSLGKELGITAQGIAEVVAGRTKSETTRYAIAAAIGKKKDDLWPEGQQDRAA